MANDDDKKKGEKGQDGFQEKSSPPISQPYHIKNPRVRDHFAPPPFRPPAEDSSGMPGEGKSPETATSVSDGVPQGPLKGADTSRVVDQVLAAASAASSPRRAVEKALVAARGRRRRTSSWPVARYWAKIPTVWKALGIVAAIFVSGASGYAALQSYADKYVTESSYSKHLEDTKGLSQELRSLRDRVIAQENSMTTAKKDLDSMREDVRTLLKHMLANPPPRPRGEPND